MKMVLSVSFGDAQFLCAQSLANICFLARHYELENNKTEEKYLCICLNM